MKLQLPVVIKIIGGFNFFFHESPLDVVGSGHMYLPQKLQNGL